MKQFASLLFALLVSLGVAQTPPPQAVTAGYSTLVWQDSFATLDVCTTNIVCNWYDPGAGLWGNVPSGIITNPSGTYLNLNVVTGQTPNNVTSIGTISPNGQRFGGWTYGYFEISMAFNPVTGNWPGLFMLPVSSINRGTQNGAELDIFEWQSNIASTFNGTIHAWSNGTELGSTGVTPTPAGITYSNYNTYGVLWTPTAVTWYLNNVSMGSVSTTSAPYNTQFNQPLGLILDESAGCNWVNSSVTPCSGQVYPLNMQVQWAHVFAPPLGSQISGTSSGVLQ